MLKQLINDVLWDLQPFRLLLPQQFLLFRLALDVMDELERETFVLSRHDGVEKLPFDPVICGVPVPWHAT